MCCVSIVATSECRAMQCVAVCCSVLQCVAVYCSVLQRVAVCCSVLQCVAVCCSVLQCVAVCCSVSQCVAMAATSECRSTGLPLNCDERGCPLIVMIKVVGFVTHPLPI